MKRESRVAFLEALALGLACALPLLPYFVRLARMPAARFIVEGDYAGLETATRYAFTGRTLLGPYSRFGFNHPGPAYFFLLAPVHALFGDASKGLYAGAVVINMAAAFTIGVATRLLASRAHALGASIVVVAWIAAFGNAAPQPWNPLVVVLPLLAFLVLATLFASGRAAAAPFAVVFGAFVAQTHLSTIPTVALVALGVTVAFVLRVRRLGALARRERRFLEVAAGVFLLSLAPIVIEEVTAREGNLTKLAHFFTHRTEPIKPFATAVKAYVAATSWLPDRLLHSSLLDELYPAAMASEPVEVMSAGASPVVILVLLVALVAALVVARKRKDHLSLAFSIVGLAASAGGLVALRGIIGETYQYLVFWTTSATTLAWMGIVMTFVPRGAWRVPVVVVVAAAVLVAMLQARWNGKWTIALAQPRSDLGAIYTALRQELRARNATPVMHREGAWPMELMLINELTRDGVDARVEERDRYLLGRQLRTPTGVSGNVIHVYVQMPGLLLPVRECTELVTTSEGIELRLAATDLRSCP